MKVHLDDIFKTEPYMIEGPLSSLLFADRLDRTLQLQSVESAPVGDVERYERINYTRGEYRRYKPNSLSIKLWKVSTGKVLTYRTVGSYYIQQAKEWLEKVKELNFDLLSKKLRDHNASLPIRNYFSTIENSRCFVSSKSMILPGADVQTTLKDVVVKKIFHESEHVGFRIYLTHKRPFTVIHVVTAPEGSAVVRELPDARDRSPNEPLYLMSGTKSESLMSRYSMVDVVDTAMKLGWKEIQQHGKQLLFIADVNLNN
ncbi:hypothetical protein AAA64_21790 [Salmonella enterica subsp. enterica serovar Dublin]|nr:hypothetical protein [Salmonella enterica subsp. enterica serovar Dublin]